VVARCWLHELWEAIGVLAPVELAGVDDNACDSGAMTADPFLGLSVVSVEAALAVYLPLQSER
jgi:hypothetical protein